MGLPRFCVVKSLMCVIGGPWLLRSMPVAALGEACADAEQMNCIGEMVVNSTGTEAIFMLRFISGGGI